MRTSQFCDPNVQKEQKNQRLLVISFGIFASMSISLVCIKLNS